MGLVVIAVGLMSCSYQAKYTLEIPEGLAAQTLKEFAKQANVEIVFKAPSLGEVRTNAVSGLMTAEAALSVMLSGTPLVFDVDSETGAYAVTADESLDTAGNIDSQSNFKKSKISVTLITNYIHIIKNTNSF